MFGFFFIKKKTSKKLSFEKLNYSSNLLKHRGPDGSKIYQDKDIFVKFFRLSIQDLSKKAMQPMISLSKKNIIVFNGEIYNFKILI
jgi:asparagine synthase (glutamine-hydrolysing)